MSDRATKVKIENQLGQTINPATEEKQDDIISAIGGIGGGSVYDNRLDETDPLYMYVGEAVAGSSDADPVWRIKRYLTSSFSGYYADGVTTFTKVWDDRATYTY